MVNLIVILCGTSINMNVYVHNPNPVPYLFNNLNSTSGIQFSGIWKNDEPSSLLSHTIAPFGTELLFIKIHFNPTQNTDLRNDTLLLGSISQLIISWTPYPGIFQTSTSLPDVLILGKNYNGTVYINSSYTIGRRVLGMTTSSDFLEIHPVLTFVRPKILTAVATVSFLLTNAILKDLPLFTNFQNISHQIEVWNEFWLTPIDLKFYFECELNGDAHVNLPIGIRLGRSQFEDIYIHIGYVLPNIEATHYFEVYNKFECPVAFHGERFDKIANSFEIISIPVTLTGLTVGEFGYRSPVTTNCTPPFWLHLSGIVVEPELQFIDQLNMVVTNLSFEDEHWNQVVYLKNCGKTGVYLQEIVSSSRSIHIHSNCSEFLEVDATCELTFTIQIRLIQNQTEFHELIVEAAGKRNTLTIKVNLSRDIVEKLKRFRFLKHFGMLIVTLIFTTGRIFIKIIQNLKNWRKRKRRLNALSKAINKLSVSRKVSIGTEIIFTNDGIGGTWEQTLEPKWIVTEGTIEAIEFMIAQLN